MFGSYVRKSKNIFLDLILNKEFEFDSKIILKGLKKQKNSDEQQNVIIISSYLSWAET